MIPLPEKSDHLYNLLGPKRKYSDNVNDDGDGSASAARLGIPKRFSEPFLVTYRSTGIGIFGMLSRFGCMPLEKIALYMNSSQVSGKRQFAQAVKLTFQEGALAPYRVVGAASVTAWFLQYSVMGFAFQFVDHTLSHLFGVKPAYYGNDLMEPANADGDMEEMSWDYRLRFSGKTLLSPVLAASLETTVANRAEVQRFFGMKQFAKVESNFLAQSKFPSLARVTGPAFFPCAMRNIIMTGTSFILTPTTYKLYFPQEKKSKTSLFWYGLSMNMFVGNVIAITQQAFWGRSLDMLNHQGYIDYAAVVKNSLQKEGIAAFFTVPKWFSRILMNAPTQGLLPWFYNEVLPIGEPTALRTFKRTLYDPFLRATEEQNSRQTSRSVA